MGKIPFSKIIAGTMSWGSWGKKCTTKQMVDLINCCVDNNITSFDHADIYGDYTTESDFGKAFIESKLQRSKVQFISKCGIQMVSQIRNNSIKHYDYTSNYIIWSVEQSLKKLQTEYLDLLLLHRPSPLLRAEEIAKVVEKLKKEGKILDFGVSNFSPLETDLIETKTKISYNQIEFSITQFDAMLNGTLNHMQIHNITPMCWSPLGDVFKKEDERTQRLKKIISLFSIKYGVTEDIILLGWILKHPAGILPVCGTTDHNRIANLMKATTIELETQDWFKLWQESTGISVP